MWNNLERGSKRENLSNYIIISKTKELNTYPSMKDHPQLVLFLNSRVLGDKSAVVHRDFCKQQHVKPMNAMTDMGDAAMDTNGLN